MIPQTDSYYNKITDDFEYVNQPSKTYRLDIEAGRVRGRYIEDNLEAVRQAVYLILQTERYANVMYSDYYGSEVKSLFGKPDELVYPEMERMITEACLMDDRVLSVKDFKITRENENRFCTFTVESIYGEFEAQTEVIV